MKLKKGGRHRLAELMEVNEISHRQLATAIGWKSHGMVRSLLSGRKNGVTPTSAVAICKFFGVPLHDLFLTELSSVSQSETPAARKAS